MPYIELISCSDLVQGPEVMTTDKYATAEAYYGLARAYSNVPDLHIMWLLYLCEVHQGNQSYAEAAQCAVAVAGVIMQVFAPVDNDPSCDVSCCFMQRNIFLLVFMVCASNEMFVLENAGYSK